MGSSNGCQKFNDCKQNGANTLINQITITAIAESSQYIPFEAMTLQCFKSQKSIYSVRETEFDRQGRQLLKQDLSPNQKCSIRALDSLTNSRFYQSNIIQLEQTNMNCSYCDKEISQDFIRLDCQHMFHDQCLQRFICTQIINNSSLLHCTCQQKIHTKFLRTIICDQNLIEKFFSNQLGTLYKNNSNKLIFQKNYRIETLLCIYCDKQLISQKVELKCKHQIHKHCLKQILSDQVEKGKSYIICPCGASIHTLILRNCKSDSFRFILSRLFKNQLIEMYNTDRVLQNKFHFKQFVKAVNLQEDQKHSSCSLP